MTSNRISDIEEISCKGNIDELVSLLGLDYSQLEIDVALGCAIAYSHVDLAKYLLSLGADFANHDYDGVYYAVHNNELEGLKFAISHGVDVNVNNGLLLNTGVITAMNEKDNSIVLWLLENGANCDLLTEESMKIVRKFGTHKLVSILESAT